MLTKVTDMISEGKKLGKKKASTKFLLAFVRKKMEEENKNDNCKYSSTLFYTRIFRLIRRETIEVLLISSTLA